MFSEFKRSLSVGDQTDINTAVSWALMHFGCGSGIHETLLAEYKDLVKPDFALVYRGYRIPVSLDDSAGTLASRIRAYLGDEADWLLEDQLAA